MEFGRGTLRLQGTGGILASVGSTTEAFRHGDIIHFLVVYLQGFATLPYRENRVFYAIYSDVVKPTRACGFYECIVQLNGDRRPIIIYECLGSHSFVMRKCRSLGTCVQATNIYLSEHHKPAH